MAANLLQQAHACLVGHFDPRWQTPYDTGKAQMADQLCKTLEIPHERAVALIDELEQNGTIRFAPVVGLQDLQSTVPASGAGTQLPLTPPAEGGRTTPEDTAPQPVLGDWIISPLGPQD
jgi:hypothetical protein